jgi:protein tyrosine phosphatase (PTP) superfamily phosphohydrolase (DUF442 family)
VIEPRAPLSAAVVLFLAVFGSAATSCASFESDDDEPPPPLHVAELGDLASVSVCGDVWLAEAPAAKHLDLAHRRGIRTVISLLPEGADGELGVAEVCRDLGMAFVPTDAAPVPTDADVDRVIAALERPGRGATLMYCESGARSAMVFSIYRVVRQGVDLDAALEAARRTGMKPGTSETFVRTQVARLSS